MPDKVRELARLWLAKANEFAVDAGFAPAPPSDQRTSAGATIR